MTAIATDRRKIDVEPDFAAHERAVAWARQRLAADLGLARELARVAETRTYAELDCASIEEYGLRLGLVYRDTRALLEAGRALDADAAGLPAPPPGSATPVPSTVEEAVRTGAASLAQATLAGRLLTRPELLREGEDPVRIAFSQPLRSVRAFIRGRTEELAQQELVSPIALAVTDRAKRGFARARALASERSGRLLTEGETFALVVEHYLDDFDPLRRAPGPRRLPDTSDLPGSREIPADVRRAVRSRSGDRCEVPGCPRDVFLEFAHITAHRDGGSRESGNLLRLCHGHHVLLDAGRIEFAGWVDGRPAFRRADGTPIDDRPGFAAAARQDRAPTGLRSDTGADQVAERPPPWRFEVARL